MVPYVVWEVGSDSGEDGKKVGLEGFYGLVSIFAMMFVRRYKVEVYPPVLFY